MLTKMKKKEQILKEVRSVLEEGPEEIKEVKNPIVDKKTGQISIRIPKSMALKANLVSKSNIKIVFNPKKQETLEELGKSKFVIYLEQ